MKFLKIGQQMFPVERVETINREANINGELGLEVKLFGVSDTFKFTRDLASSAYDLLEGIADSRVTPTIDNRVVVLTIDGKVAPYLSLTTAAGETLTAVVIDGVSVRTESIVWVDFETNFGATGIGIELQIDGEPTTRKFVQQAASDVYDALVALASNQEAAAAA